MSSADMIVRKPVLAFTWEYLEHVIIAFRFPPCMAGAIMRDVNTLITTLVKRGTCQGLNRKAIAAACIYIVYHRAKVAREEWAKWYPDVFYQPALEDWFNVTTPTIRARIRDIRAWTAPHMEANLS